MRMRQPQAVQSWRNTAGWAFSVARRLAPECLVCVDVADNEIEGKVRSLGMIANRTERYASGSKAGTAEQFRASTESQHFDVLGYNLGARQSLGPRPHASKTPCKTVLAAKSAAYTAPTTVPLPGRR